MNTRAAALFEGIANNAILMAYGVTEVEELPDTDLQIGVLLALLQDDAKNQSSYLTWGEGVPQAEVARDRCAAISWSPWSAPTSSPAPGDVIRCWAACICRPTAPAHAKSPVCAAATPPRSFSPVLYGAKGLVDITTIDKVL